MSTETNFDFFLFLLNTWDVTNGIISGFYWRSFCEHDQRCMWVLVLSRDLTRAGKLREENRLTVVTLAKWPISGMFCLKSFSFMSQWTLTLGS